MPADDQVIGRRRPSRRQISMRPEAAHDVLHRLRRQLDKLVRLEAQGVARGKVLELHALVTSDDFDGVHWQVNCASSA